MSAFFLLFACAFSSPHWLGAAIEARYEWNIGLSMACNPRVPKRALTKTPHLPPPRERGGRGTEQPFQVKHHPADRERLEAIFVSVTASQVHFFLLRFPFKQKLAFPTLTSVQRRSLQGQARALYDISKRKEHPPRSFRAIKQETGKI